jgi:hypothetical protein
MTESSSLDFAGVSLLMEIIKEFQNEQILIMGEIDYVHPRWVLELAEKLIN